MHHNNSEPSSMPKMDPESMRLMLDNSAKNKAAEIALAAANNYVTALIGSGKIVNVTEAVNALSEGVNLLTPVLEKRIFERSFAELQVSLNAIPAENR